MSPKQHQLRELGGKHMSASEKTRKLENCIISESKQKVRKEEPKGEDSDFEGYDKSTDNGVHVSVKNNRNQSKRPDTSTNTE